MLIPIFPPPSMLFDESVYIDLISHIKRQTLMRVSSSSVNVIPWCDSFHGHLYGAEGSSFKQSQLLAFFLKEIPGRGEGGRADLPARMEVLRSRTPLIPLSLPVICFIIIVFQDQLPAVRGNKFDYAQKTKRIEWQGSKQPAKGLYVCLNHAKTQAGMPSASRSSFCWVTGRINIWPLMHFFEGIKKVKRSIIYSSSIGNSVRQASCVWAAVSHFV